MLMLTPAVSVLEGLYIGIRRRRATPKDSERVLGGSVARLPKPPGLIACGGSIKRAKSIHHEPLSDGQLRERRQPSLGDEAEDESPKSACTAPQASNGSCI
jgi:hypothetical protein